MSWNPWQAGHEFIFCTAVRHSFVGSNCKKKQKKLDSGYKIRLILSLKFIFWTAVGHIFVDSNCKKEKKVETIEYYKFCGQSNMLGAKCGDFGCGVSF